MSRPSTERTTTRPGLQRVARRGFAGLAQGIVLVPIILAIWFCSSMPRGWEQVGALVWKLVSEGPPGGHTETVVPNTSGHDVQRDTIRFAEHRDDFTRPPGSRARE